MGCKGCSELYLNVLNGLMLGCSLVIIGYSAYLATSLSDFSEILTTGAIISPLVFGVFLLLVSIVGICGTAYRNKCMLLIYILVATLITLVVLVSGGVLLAFSGVLEDVGSQNIQIGEDKLLEEVQDFQLAFFVACCEDEPGFVSPPECSDADDSVCIRDNNKFVDLLDVIPDQVCEALEEVKLDGVPLTGPDGCGGGDAATFVSSISTFLQDNIKAVGITNLVLAVIMLLDLIAACVLLWSKKEQYGYGAAEEKKEEKKGDYNNVNAPDLADGGNVMKY